MNSKLRRYAIEQLSSTGFVLLDSKHAFALRPDIWSTPIDCGVDLTLTQKDEMELLRLNVVLFKAVSVGLGLSIRGATRSMRDLERRIEFVTSLIISNVTVVDDFSLSVKSHDPVRIETPIKQDNIEALRALALQDPPSHDCALRKEILRTRQALADRGIGI